MSPATNDIFPLEKHAKLAVSWYKFQYTTNTLCGGAKFKTPKFLGEITREEQDLTLIAASLFPGKLLRIVLRGQFFLYNQCFGMVKLGGKTPRKTDMEPKKKWLFVDVFV